MAQLTRVLRALYCEPWLIWPSMHGTLCEFAWAHVTGAAHNPDGIAASFRDTARKADADGDGGVKGDIQILDGVALLSIDGVIGRKFSKMLNHSGVTSIDVFERLIYEAVGDDEIGAVVLDVDSPGGTVTGVPDAANAVAKLSKVKPVVAFTGGMMASAAYWISAPADAIFAGSSADVGSIGVYAALLDVTRQMEMEGKKTELFKVGKYKAMGVPGVPLTDEQREWIEKEVTRIGQWFKGDVRANRSAVEESAMEGQTFMGRDALEVGLVDRLGTLDEAVEYARQEAARRR